MRGTSEFDRRIRGWLIAALVVGALVRLPGVAWGVNFPDGFTTHHPDETTHVVNANAIITPLEPHIEPAYPKAMGAYAAAPFLAWYLLHGHFGGPRVHLPWTVGAGRLVSVIFGVIGIWLVFAICRDALGDRSAGVGAAWCLALGGLHVTQSHFFVADVAATTWTLAAVWLLWRDLTLGGPSDHESLRWAAFAAGSAFALKLFVFAFPALAYAALARRPRFTRAAHAIIFVAAAVAISSLGFDTPADYYRALTAGVNYPFTFDRVRGALLYAIELPSILSLPLLVGAVCGTWSLAFRTGSSDPLARRHAVVIFGAVPLLAIFVIVAKLDHFPRHWVLLIPWAAIAAGWWLARVTDWLTRHGRSPAIVIAPMLVWMLAFVVDGERYFIFDPRNDAARWLRTHVAEGSSVFWTWHRAPAGYRSVRWPLGNQGDPDVLVIEMFDANNYVSGVNWRESYPTDPRQVFDGQSAERVAAVQSLFKGTSDYQVAARFRDDYVMPEYRLTQRLLGDRARSYISEVVIFTRRGA
jgi:4-amino-4-deoxy-L-arabinose transferase-like glycosyltransferase